MEEIGILAVFFGFLIVLLIGGLGLSGLRVVKEYERAVIFRLGNSKE